MKNSDKFKLIFNFQMKMAREKKWYQAYPLLNKSQNTNLRGRENKKSAFVADSLDNESAEFPLSRRMNVSRPSRALAHGQAWLSDRTSTLEPQSFARGLKLEQDSSATSLQDYCIAEQELLSTKNPTKNSEAFEDFTLQGISRFGTDIMSIAKQKSLSSPTIGENSKALEVGEVASPESRCQTGLSLLSTPRASVLYHSGAHNGQK